MARSVPVVSVPVALPPVPVYFDSQTSGRDDTLMVFFDTEGLMQGASVNLGVGDTGQSGAAFVGQGVQELLK